MKKITLLLITFLSFVATSCNQEIKRPAIHLIPQPNHLIEKEGVFTITRRTTISVNSKKALDIGEFLRTFLMEKFSTSSDIQIKTNTIKNNIHFLLAEDLSLPTEGYDLNINSKNIQIKAASLNGLFLGLNTLMQLLSELENKLVLPNLNIKDSPRFKWRGMHLDVSRHFMPVSFIKKYLDIMAMYKLNVFHWHLVDGVGWRIEIKSHPELTNIGAWRVVKKDKKPWQDVEAWKKGDTRPKYGGFYTQEEIKEIVTYAQKRFITIVPEIELPGHSEIVFDCYPDLLCKDNQGKSLKNIGVYCANNPHSYQLLEDVITEVIDLFPSEYIHIGGDEVSKENWTKCVNCKKLMKDNHYNPQEVQSHFINHFDKFIRLKNRKLIGWHEITEGNLSPSSTIMFWHGINGLKEILTKKHPTVIASGTSYYFDHYQSLSEQEPEAWGGFSPLKQVYDLEPVSSKIDANLQKQILGIQGQVWTEYMPTPKHIEYMLLPRMLALAESAWTLPQNKEWKRFANATLHQFKKYEKKGINYSKSAIRPIIEMKIDSSTRKLRTRIYSEIPSDIYYTLDGRVPTISQGTKYTAPFLLDTAAIVSAISVKNGIVLTKVEKQAAIVHKARGCRVTFKNKPYSSYSANGGSTLVDMEFGGRTWGSGKWIGVLDKDFDIFIDLEKETVVSKTILSCINDTGSGIYFPARLEAFVSQDGISFNSVKKWERDFPVNVPISLDHMRRKFTLDFKPVKCKYVRLKASCVQLKNQGVFIFADEVIIE